MNGLKGYTYSGSISVPTVSDREVYRQACEVERLRERDASQDQWLAGTITREQHDANTQAGWARFHDKMRAYGKGGAL